MKKTRDEVLRIVRAFQTEIVPVYGDRLEGVYLYGSYARDEADEDSDIDVAVVLRGPVNRHAEIRRVSEVRARLSLADNCLLMPFFLSDEESRKTPDAVFRSIVREGQAV
jgi:type I restriction enzyme S subunit